MGTAGGADNPKAHADVQPTSNWSGESSSYVSLSESSSLLSRPIPPRKGGRMTWGDPRRGPGVGKGPLECARAPARKAPRNKDATRPSSRCSSSDEGIGRGRVEEGRSSEGEKEGAQAPEIKKHQHYHDHHHHHQRLQQHRLKHREHRVDGKDYSRRQPHHASFEGVDKPSWSRRSTSTIVNKGGLSDSTGWPAKIASDAGLGETKAGCTALRAVGTGSSSRTGRSLRERHDGVVVDAAGRDSEWTAERRAATQEVADLLGEIRHTGNRLWHLVGGGV